MHHYIILLSIPCDAPWCIFVLMHCDALLYDFVFMPCDSLLYNFVLFSLRFCNCYPPVICLSNIMSNIANLSVGRLNSSNISWAMCQVFLCFGRLQYFNMIAEYLKYIIEIVLYHWNTQVTIKLQVYITISNRLPCK